MPTSYTSLASTYSSAGCAQRQISDTLTYTVTHNNPFIGLLAECTNFVSNNETNTGADAFIVHSFLLHYFWL